MAGKWIEGFESHIGSSQMARKYAQTSGSFSSTAGRVAGVAGSPISAVAVTPSLGLDNTWVLGFGLFVNNNNSALATDNNGLYLEKGSAEQIHLEFETDPTGFKVKIVRDVGGSATVIAETGFDYPFGAWVYFEFKCTVRTGSNGAYELRANGVQVLTGTSVNTAAAGSDGADVFAFRFVDNLGGNVRFDDLYLVDSQGASNNDFLGPSVVEATNVTANGAQNDWTNDFNGVQANNWDQMNDAATGTDETTLGGTISSDTNGHVELYETSDLQQVTGNIHFVQIGVQAAMAAAGSRTLRHKYRDPDTTVHDGDSFVVDSTQYDEFITIYDTNPTTGTAWDVADIDGGQFGLEVVS